MSTYTKHFILLCGDLNIDLKQQNSICSKLNNTMDSLGLTQIVTEPTHYGNHKNSLIDHVWTNELNSTTTIVDLDISDHLAIEINLPTNTTLDSNCTIRNTSEENVKKAMQLIDDESESLSTCSILNFLNSLINILDKTCPLITVQQNKNDGIKFTPDSKYKELKKKCRNLINKMSHSPSAHLKTEYKRKRKEKNIHAEKLLKDEAKKQIELCNGDQAKLWRIINSRSGNLKCSTENKLEIKRLDNTMTSDTEEICNIFADFFEEIPTKTVNEINDCDPIYNHIEFNHNRFTNFSELNEDRLTSILSSIDSKSSTGVDGISMKLLKKLMPSLKIPLLAQLNRMIRQNKIDPILKLAKTIPLFKKGDKSLTVNYRPISLLIAISKILEKSMNLDIINHIDKTLDDRQFGFRKLKGTIDALTDIVDDVTLSKNQGLEAASACIDISKAFDTLNHDILLKKLYQIGFEGNALELIQDYLTDRKFLVEINNVQSKSKKITMGVPQGSILGPTLFLIYINDLPKFLGPQCSTVMFADDTTMTVKAKNHDELKSKLKTTLERAHVWFSANKMAMNVSKTRIIHYFNDTPLQMKLNDMPVENVGPHELEKSFKLLGIELDNRLKFDIHITQLAQKIKRLLYAMRKLKDYTDFKTRKMFFHSFIQSNISYGIAVWGTKASKKQKDILNKLYKQALRLLVNKKYKIHTKDICKRNKILDFETLFLRQKGTQAFKKLENGDLELLSSGRLRDAMQVYVPNDQGRQRRIITSEAIFWNNLPENIRKIRDNTFKTELKLYLIGKIELSVCTKPHCRDHPTFDPG